MRALCYLLGLIGVAFATITSASSCGPLAPSPQKIERELSGGGRQVIIIRGGILESQQNFDVDGRLIYKMGFDSRDRIHTITIDPETGKELTHVISQ